MSFRLWLRATRPETSRRIAGDAPSEVRVGRERRGR
jgi:hypothetical protein